MTFSARAGLEATFWLSCGLVAYTYAVYPLLLFALSSAAELARAWRHLVREPESSAAAPPLPGVSVIIAAHDEEREIPGLCASLRALEYPRERLEVVLVSDGSSDGTDGCFQRLREPWMRLLRQPQRAGKASALNAGVDAARHNILVLL
ncbi:MAG: glycosyltransferase, partial [Terriglobales bacterium]